MCVSLPGRVANGRFPTLPPLLRGYGPALIRKDPLIIGTMIQILVIGSTGRPGILRTVDR